MRLLCVALVCCALVACDSKKDAPPEASAPAAPAEAPVVKVAIAAAKGGVAGDKATAFVELPAGAVERDVEIQLQPASPESRASEGVRVLGQVWRFTVAGHESFTFRRPVRIGVPYDPSRMKEGTKPESIGLSVWREDRWEKVPGAKADPKTRQVVAEVDHFTEFVPTQDDVIESVMEEKRKRLLDHAVWHARIRVDIRGAGRKGDSDAGQSFTIAREAQLAFRIPVAPGQMELASAYEEMKKRSSFKLPPQMEAAYQEALRKRMWVSHALQSKPEDAAEVTIRVDDASSGWGRGGGEEGDDDAGTTSRTIKGGYQDKASARASLTIDLVKGTYAFRVEEIEGGEVVSTGAPPEEGDPKKAKASVAIDVKDRPLPPSGSVLRGQLRIPRAKIPSAIGEIPSGSFSFGSTRGTISWELSPEPMEDVELVLRPDRYDDWMPKGGPNETTKGNEIRVTAMLRRRGGGATTAKMKRLVVRLDEVSREPGVCLNVPLSGGAAEPDLKLRADTGGKLQDNGLRILKDDGEFAQLAFTVECFDWGAYGALEAVAALTDGRVAFSTLDGDPSQLEVLLPKRKPESKVADKWRAEMGAEGADTEDADKQQGNRNDGDGLTLYEEYRGMFAKGKHTREHAAKNGMKPLSPARKDLVVCNRIRGEAGVDAGITLFEDASGINVVQVDDAEFPSSRCVNVNAGQLTAGPQHGLLVIDAAVPGAAGGAQGIPTRRLEPPITVSPKGFEKVNLDIAGMKAEHVDLAAVCRLEGIPVPDTLVNSMANTTAHELAHGLGVKHHGAVDDRAPYNEVTSAMADVTVYDRKERPITSRPVPITGGVSWPGNASSGDVNCIMTYNGIYNWSWHDRPRIFYAVPLIPQGRTFCTSGAATGVNAPHAMKDGKNSPGLFGKSGRGNCLGQMRVKD